MGIQIAQNWSTQVSAINNAVPNQMSRTFYVDAVNGDDNNDGSSLAPFKTIKKAVESIPVGGMVIIYLKTAGNVIDSDIIAANKTIIINGTLINSSSTEPAIKNLSYADEYGNATYGFIINNCYLEFVNLTIRTADFVDSSKAESYFAGLVKRYDTQSKNKVVLNQTSILLGDTDFMRISDRQDINLQVYYYDYQHSVTDKTIDCVGANTNAFLLRNEAGTFIISVSSVRLGTKNDNSSQLTWEDIIAGVVKDANGVPRNVISNIVF